MSKSRSNDEKERDKDKEKEPENETDREKVYERDTEKESDSENEEERQERGCSEEKAKGQQNVRLAMNQLQLTDETESNLKSPIFDSNSLMVKNDPAIPSSPPPSYEHVIEQTRLEHAAEVQKYEDGKSSHGNDASGEDNRTKAPKILHKSSKELYRAVAKQWGITCKMSDHCRCLDCQSRYFDCEYDKNENQKTDGGLGAGTPMFISEVMHGTACVLL